MEEIGKIIIWYRDIPEGYTNINRLMYSRQKLSAWIYTLSEEMSRYKEHLNKCQAVYERNKSTIRGQNLDKGVTKANYISREETVQDYDNWKKADADYRKFFYLYKSTEEVLSSMSQHIALLRQELERSKKD